MEAYNNDAKLAIPASTQPEIAHYDDSQPPTEAEAQAALDKAVGIDMDQIWNETTQRSTTARAGVVKQAHTAAGRTWKQRILAPMRRPQPICAGLSRGQVGMLHGPGGSAKTQLALRIALACAAPAGIDLSFHAGRPDLPFSAPPAAARGRVLYASAEDHPAFIDARVGALAAYSIEELGVERDEVLAAADRVTGVETDGAWLAEDAGWDQLATWGAENVLIILDPLAGIVPADAEKDNAAMAQIILRMNRIARETGAAILLVHHDGKPGRVGGTGIDAARGASALAAHVRSGWQIIHEKTQDHDRYRISATKLNHAAAWADIFGTIRVMPNEGPVLVAHYTIATRGTDDKPRPARAELNNDDF